MKFICFNVRLFSLSVYPFVFVSSALNRPVAYSYIHTALYRPVAYSYIHTALYRPVAYSYIHTALYRPVAYSYIHTALYRPVAYSYILGLPRFRFFYVRFGFNIWCRFSVISVRLYFTSKTCTHNVNLYIFFNYIHTRVASGCASRFRKTYRMRLSSYNGTKGI